MNHLLSLFAALLFFFNSYAKDGNYTGSTPAGKTVRSFLSISLTDSIDFIRWKVNIQEDRFLIKCNYGIGKPNTNGFMEGGKWVDLQGKLEKKQNIYRLQNGNKVLQLAVLNDNLLHLLDEQGKLLIGNDGWSYALNSETPTTNTELHFSSNQHILEDSISFAGRTPCLPFHYGYASPNCYKLKWSLVLYSDAKNNFPTIYYLRGSVVNHERKKGTWTRIKGKDGRTIYRLQSENKEVLNLVALDENVVALADEAGNLLVGNEDFSYTLNRK